MKPNNEIDFAAEEAYADDLAFVKNAFSKADSELKLPDALKSAGLIKRINQQPPSVETKNHRAVRRRWFEITAYAACFAMVMFGLHQSVLNTTKNFEVKQSPVSNNIRSEAAAKVNSQSRDDLAIPKMNPSVSSATHVESEFAQNPLFATDEPVKGQTVLPDQPAVSDYHTLANALVEFDAQTESDVMAEGSPRGASEDTFELALKADRHMEPMAGHYVASSVENANVQESNLSESDFLVADGQFLYHFVPEHPHGGSAIEILKAENLNRVSTIGLGDNSKVRMHLSDDRLVVVRDASAIAANDVLSAIDSKISEVVGSKAEKIEALPSAENSVVRSHQPMTEIIIFDMTKKEKPNIVAQTIVDGSYLVSEIQRDIFFLVSNKTVMLNRLVHDKASDLFPVVKDDDMASILKPDKIITPANYEASGNPAYTIITSIDLKAEKKSVTAVLGKTSKVLINNGNLYLVSEAKADANDAFKIKTSIIKMSNGNSENSEVYYVSQNEIEGTLESSDAIKEYGGNLQIAAANYDEKGERTYEIVLFDELLHLITSFSETARGEKISDYRLMGKHGYISTMADETRVYAVDFENLRQPKIEELVLERMMPRTLIPVDSEKAIGIGYNTQKDLYGGTLEDGIVLSLFNVKNPAKIEVIDTVLIGNAGSRSLAVEDIRFVVHNDNRKFFGFPVTLFTARGATLENPWGKDQRMAFDGILIFEIEESQISVAGEIPNEEARDGVYRSDIDDVITDAVCTNDVLYAVSVNRIAAYDIMSGALLREVMH